MQARHKTKNPIPVIKRPRREWCIPRVAAGAKLAAEQAEEARLAALKEATTPHGRELLRQTLWWAERQLNLGTKAHDEVIKAVAGEALTFKALQPEWALLLSRIWGGNPEVWRQACPTSFAKLVVLILEEQKRMRALEGSSSEAQRNHEKSGVL